MHVLLFGLLMLLARPQASPEAAPSITPTFNWILMGHGAGDGYTFHVEGANLTDNLSTGNRTRVVILKKGHAIFTADSPALAQRKEKSVTIVLLKPDVAKIHMVEMTISHHHIALKIDDLGL